jgi:hypothetical protein
MKTMPTRAGPLRFVIPLPAPAPREVRKTVGSGIEAASSGAVLFLVKRP